MKDSERTKRRATRDELRKANSAWSNGVARKEERDKRKEKKVKKRKWLKSQQLEAANVEGESAVSSLKRSRDEDDNDDKDDDDADDWAELAREEKMAKKVRRGEVTQKVFDAEFNDLDIPLVNH